MAPSSTSRAPGSPGKARRAASRASRRSTAPPLLLLLAIAAAFLLCLAAAASGASADAFTCGNPDGLENECVPLTAEAEDAVEEAGEEQAFDEQASAEEEKIDPEHWDLMHGGWNLTWEVFDRATKHPNATVVSWASPRVLLIRDFLTPEEVEHLVAAAEAEGFERSEVVSDDEPLTNIRTSVGMWLTDERRDAKVVEIEKRIHDLVGIPHPMGEELHVLKYKNLQKYEAHVDHCNAVPGKPESKSCLEFVEGSGGPACGPGAGGVTCGDRLATFILYLRAPDAGGATVFPLASSFRTLHAASGTDDAALYAGPINGEDGEEQIPEYCLPEAGTLKVSPPAGSAVFFWDHTPGGKDWREGDLTVPDPASEHGGCPVLAGEKIIATRWFRSTQFRP